MANTQDRKDSAQDTVTRKVREATQAQGDNMREVLQPLHQTETGHPRNAGTGRRSQPWSEMVLSRYTRGKEKPGLPHFLLPSLLPVSFTKTSQANDVEAEKVTYPTINPSDPEPAALEG